MALSGAYPNAEAIQRLISGVTHKVSEVVTSQASLAERHNTYTDYIIAFLYCATGHRPIVDPFQSLQQINLEAGLVLVSDKVSNENRAWNLVALPQIAIQQIQAYLDYLPKLTARLRENNSGLAVEVHKLDSPARSQLPLFFYITDDLHDWQQIMPGKMEKRLQEFWNLPLNFMRHMMATELITYTRRPDWVRIQLGHSDGIDHPFGTSSTESPVETLNQIAIPLDHIMRSLGWQIIASPIRMSSNFSLKTTSQRSKAIKVRTLGHDMRKHRRSQRQLTVANTVREILKQQTGKDLLDELSPDAFNYVLEELLRRADEQQQSPNQCLRLLYRYLSRLKGGKDLLRKLKRLRVIEPEASPFSSHSLLDLNELKMVRMSFLSYLERSAKDTKTPEQGERIAEIIASAALFSGLADTKRLKALVTALQENLFKFEQTVFIDIPLSEISPKYVFRWYPDNISRNLSMGLRMVITGTQRPSVRSKTVSQTLKSLLKKLGLPGKMCPFEQLSVFANTALIFEYPGFVASCLSGEIPSVSLPLPQFMRVLTNKSLAYNVTAENKFEDTDDTPWLLTLQQSRKHPDVDEAARLKKVLHQCMNSAVKAPPKGNQKQITRQKKVLVECLKEEFKDTSHWSILSILIVNWTIYLCKQGTRSKNKLAFNTVQQYPLIVVNALFKSNSASNFLDLDEAAYEEIYLNIIQFSEAKTKERKLGRIVEFHEFLVQEYCVDSPDWTAIYAAADIKKQLHYADANLVTYEEYQLTLNDIFNDDQLNSRLRTQYAALVLFGYHFGLRFSEALTLQYRDVQYDEALSHLLLHVRANIYAGVKSHTGTRTLPLLAPLTETERLVLMSLLTNAENEFTDDTQAGLFSDEGTRELLPRDQATMYLHAALRTVTGDQTIRYHSFRHGFATRLVDYHFIHNHHNERTLSSSLHPKSINDNTWRDFIGGGTISFPLRSISVAIGHASESTTIGSYIHSIDRFAQCIANQYIPQLSDQVLSYLVGIDQSTIRKRRSRKTPLVMEKDYKNFHEPEIHLVIRRNFFRATDKYPAFRDDAQITLVKLDRLLKGFSSEIPINILSRRFEIHTHIARKIRVEALELQRESGFISYGLQELHDDPIQKTGSIFALPKKLPVSENARVRNLLRLLDKKLDESIYDKEQLAYDLGKWKKSYTSATNANLVTDFDELHSITELIRFISDEIKIMIDLDTETAYDESLLKELKQLGYGVDYRKILRAKEKTFSRKLGRVQVLVELIPDEIGTRHTLHRIIFLISLYSKLTNV